MIGVMAERPMVPDRGLDNWLWVECTGPGIVRCGGSGSCVTGFGGFDQFGEDDASGSGLDRA